MRKVYDCFTFFNELDLLELRLTECYNDADYFVISEHSGYGRTAAMRRGEENVNKI